MKMVLISHIYATFYKIKKNEIKYKLRDDILEKLPISVFLFEKKLLYIMQYKCYMQICPSKRFTPVVKHIYRLYMHYNYCKTLKYIIKL